METNASLSPKAIVDYRRAFQKRAQARFQAREKRRQQAKQAALDAIGTIISRYSSCTTSLFVWLLLPDTTSLLAGGS